MALSMFTVPPSVTQNISRAKAYIRRTEPVKAIESLLAALALFEPKKIIGKARYETEILLMECVDELNRNQQVQRFLKKVSRELEPRIPYVPGQEDKLASILPIVMKVLEEENQQRADKSIALKDERRNSLWEKGSELIKAGEAPKGRSVLRRLGDEFGDEPGVLTQIGEILVGNELLFEAIEFLEQAIEFFPKDHRAYAALLRAYTELREFEKAEETYIKALKQFGQHPQTLINFAKMYRLWGKRDKTFEFAQKANRLAPDNEEAKELMNWGDRR